MGDFNSSESNLAMATSAQSPRRNKASIVDQTVETIRNEIKMGRLAPGQRLVEAELCEATRASRATIREVLSRLRSEGLVEVEHQKGARVRRLTMVDVRNIYQIREALEGTAARLAACHIDHCDYRERLEKLQKNPVREWNHGASEYMQYNEAFHRLIVEMSENSRLIHMVEQLQHSAFLALIQVLSTPEAVKIAHDEHAPIVKAILAGDEVGAESAMRKHIRRTGESLVGRIVSFLK